MPSQSELQKRQKELDTERETRPRNVYSHLDYYFRCPHCDKFNGKEDHIADTENYHQDQNVYQLEEVEISDRLTALRCGWCSKLFDIRYID